MRVSEPEPGRVPIESDRHSGLATAFTVTPGAQQQAEVTIEKRWERQGGLRGVLDRIFTPPVMRRIYREKLAILDRYARRKRQT